jgi:hypothetical protein
MLTWAMCEGPLWADLLLQKTEVVCTCRFDDGRKKYSPSFGTELLASQGQYLMLRKVVEK